jgi:thymidylate kinase
MSKPKLIVLEGPDRIGKTTQLRELASRFKAKILVQPSEDNSVGYLRNIVKNDKSLLPGERQLLHTISHIFDANEQFDYKSNVIMDRCHISALVYGKITGVENNLSAMIQDIHKSAYTAVAAVYDIHVVFMTRETPYNLQETDEFEKTINWNNLREAYETMYDVHRTRRRIFTFPESKFAQESVHRVDVGNMSVQEVTDLIVRRVNGAN